MKYKLIACDMDETLLDDNHEICRRNLELIKKAREEYGIKFVPATGRGYELIQKQLKILGLYDKENEYVLSFNGGALTENKNNRILQFKGLEFNKAKELFNYGLKLNICIHVYTKDELYLFNMTDNEREQFKKFRYNEKKENSIDFLKDEEISKVMYQNSDLKYLMGLEEGIKEITDGSCSVSYSSNRFMEFNALGVDKGQGVIDLAKLLNIDIKEIIAVGDNYNDVSMLKIAGLSIAANNALEDVKDICDYTTEATNNEGVIAEVIEKFILNK